MVLSCHHEDVQNYNLLIGSKSFENVALRKTLTTQNCIHEEVKSRLNVGECLLPFSSEFLFFLNPL
jgi:hypothetical protein